MKHVIALAEHRKGSLRDTTWEAVSLGKQLAAESGAEFSVVLLAAQADALAGQLAKECPKVIVAEDPGFENFNSEAYMKAIPKILEGWDSFLVLMGNSNAHMDLAPGLSVKLDAALATDCLGVKLEDGRPIAARQMYGYKVNTTVSFKQAERIVITLRSGATPYQLTGAEAGAIEKIPSPIAGENIRKKWNGWVESEKGDVDIAAADIIVSIGRGVGDDPDMSVFESLAEAMGGVLACSRPIVDKSLLPKYHQVGTSGIEVKPKVYLALGISGAFQHVGGIKGSPLIVAVNKDSRAPIFRVAQFGIVGDIYDVVPALEEKIRKIKG